MYPFLFKCSWNFDGKIIIDHGVIYADTWTDAMAKLESDYGNDLIEILSLLCCEEGTLRFNEDIYAELYKYNIGGTNPVEPTDE